MGQRVLYKGEPWPFFVLVLVNGEVFLSRREPVMYDASAQRMSVREIPPGSTVRVNYYERDGVRWMTAIQVITLMEDQSPFDPVG